MTKVTKKDNFKSIMEVLVANGREDLAEVMAHEIELIEKKSANAKATKNQVANEGIKDLILKVMAELDRPVTITELINASEELKTATNGSNQKVSALMTQLKNANQVVRTQEGKKAMFSLAD